MQTTAADIRAGWRRFRAWKQRFWLSTRGGRGLQPRELRDIIYLVDCHQIRALEFDELAFDEVEVANEAAQQKIAFMQAYLSVAAWYSHNFEAYVRAILNLQSRLSAPNVLGFWFWQSDFAKFGAGFSPFFQGEDISIFCENAKQIDFSDISAVLPYDHILIRHPTAKWNANKAQKLANYIASDLASNGLETKFKTTFSWNLLDLNILSPNYGGLNLNWLRASQAADMVGRLLNEKW
jgi:hypothetical protein